MRILIIGFFAFSVWSAISTYIYVCEIKGLCDDSIEMQIEAINPENSTTNDAISKSIPKEEKIIPNDLIIYFAFDKYDVKSNDLLENYFISSKEYLDQNSLAKISITGHTDAIGSDNYNQTLGYRRAQSLQYYFESKGMQKNRININSKGEKNPSSDNNTSSGRANNRRSVITIKQ